MKCARFRYAICLLLLIPLLSSCSKKVESTYDGHIKTGQIYAKIGKDKDAIREYKAALDITPDSAEAHYLLGISFRKLNNIRDARDHLEKCLELDPLYNTALQELGYCALAEGNIEEALEFADALISKEKDNATAYLLMGEIESSRQNTDDAISNYLHAIELDPQLIDARSNVAKLLATRKEYAKAEEQCLYIINNIDSKDLPVHFLLADIYSVQENFEEAYAQLEKVLEIDKHNMRAKISKANIDLFLKEYDTAQEIVDEVLLQNSQYVPAIYLKANILFEKGKFEDAIITYQKLVGVKSDWSEAHLRLGMALANTGQTQQAISSLQQAIQSNPKNLQASQALTNIYIRLGLHDEAIHTLKNALDYYPNNVELLQQLALAYGTLNRLDEAEEIFNQIVSINPDFTQSYLSLAYLYLSKKDPDEAIKKSKQAIEQAPTDPIAKNILALAWMQKEEYNNAIAIFEEIKETHDSFIPAYLNLAKIYLTSNQPDKATGEYKKALEINPKTTTALLGLGSLAEKNNQSEIALDYYTKALEANAKESKVYFALASIHHKMGNKVDAKHYLNELIKLSPRNILGRMLLATLFHEEQNIGDMKLQLDEILKVKSDFLPALINAGIASYYQGNIVESIGHMRNAIRISDKKGNLSLILSWLYYLNDEKIKSHDYGSEATAILENNSHPIILFANTLYLSNRTDEALETINAIDMDEPRLKSYYLAMLDFVQAHPSESEKLLGTINQVIIYASFKWSHVAIQKAIMAHKSVPELLFPKQLLATLYAITRNSEGAIEIYEDMYTKDPSSHIALSLGNLYFEIKDKEKTIHYFNKTLESDPTQTQAWMKLGSLYEAHEQTTDALNCYQKVITIDPNHALALNNAAWILATSQNDIATALSYAETAHSILENSGSIKDTLGWIYYLNGEINKAKTMLEDAIKIFPEHPSLHYHMAKILHDKGDIGKALEHLNYALSRSQSFPGAEDAKDLLEQLEESAGI